jgi:hypothetical protein
MSWRWLVEIGLKAKGK